MATVDGQQRTKHWNNMKVACAALFLDRRIKMCAFFVDETTCCVRRAFILRPCSVCSLSGNMDFYSLAAAHRKDAGIGRGENSSAPLVVS